MSKWIPDNTMDRAPELGAPAAGSVVADQQLVTPVTTPNSPCIQEGEQVFANGSIAPPTTPVTPCVEAEGQSIDHSCTVTSTLQQVHETLATTTGVKRKLVAEDKRAQAEIPKKKPKGSSETDVDANEVFVSDDETEHSSPKTVQHEENLNRGNHQTVPDNSRHDHSNGSGYVQDSQGHFGYAQPYPPSNKSYGGYTQPYAVTNQSHNGYAQPYEVIGQSHGGYAQPYVVTSQSHIDYSHQYPVTSQSHSGYARSYLATNNFQHSYGYQTHGYYVPSTDNHHRQGYADHGFSVASNHPNWPAVPNSVTASHYVQNHINPFALVYGPNHVNGPISMGPTYIPSHMANPTVVQKHPGGFEPARHIAFSSSHEGYIDRPVPLNLSHQSEIQQNRLNQQVLEQMQDCQDFQEQGACGGEISDFTELSADIQRLTEVSAQNRSGFQLKCRVRNDLFQILRGIENPQEFQNCGLYMVGSSVNGMGEQESDLDMCLMLYPKTSIDRESAIDLLHIVRDAVSNTRFVQQGVIPASVPIVRLLDPDHQIEVDLNVNNSVGLRNTQLMNCYARIDPRVRPLVLTAKVWAKAQGIRGAQNQMLSSYSLTLMMLHYLQRCDPPVVPCLSKQMQAFSAPQDGNYRLFENLPEFSSRNHESLGSLFLGFLKYYENFDFYRHVISIRLGGEAKRRMASEFCLICIEEPFTRSNTARVVRFRYQFRKITCAFAASARKLRITGRLRSILTHMKFPGCDAGVRRR